MQTSDCNVKIKGLMKSEGLSKIFYVQCHLMGTHRSRKYGGERLKKFEINDYSVLSNAR